MDFFSHFFQELTLKVSQSELECFVFFKLTPAGRGAASGWEAPLGGSTTGALQRWKGDRIEESPERDVETRRNECWSYHWGLRQVFLTFATGQGKAWELVTIHLVAENKTNYHQSTTPGRLRKGWKRVCKGILINSRTWAHGDLCHSVIKTHQTLLCPLFCPKLNRLEGDY